MPTQIVEESIKPWQLIAEFEQQLSNTESGATASFVGTMRDFNADSSVSSMTLEHYPQMTAHWLNKLEQQAFEQWPALKHCLLVHRVGEIFPGEAIVVIACWSAHRRAALDACNWLIEALKHQAPFWKKEQRPDGEKWVKCNTDGHE